MGFNIHKFSTLRRLLIKIWRRSDHFVPYNSNFEVGHDCQISNLAFLYKLFFGIETIGTFVEIGANDGVQVSNTYCLAKKGWRGELVEPISQLATRAYANYCKYPLISVHNIAIGAPDQKEIVLNVAGLLSTARPELFEEYRQTSWAKESLTDESIRIKATTLDKFLFDIDMHQNFELLVIDVEGYEAQVIAGFDIDYWKPKMIIVELSDTHPDLRVLSQEHAGINLELLIKGYIVVYKDAINTMFVSKEFYLEVFSLKL